MNRRRVLAYVGGAVGLILLKLAGRDLFGHSAREDPAKTDATARRLLAAIGPQESAAVLGDVVLAASSEPLTTAGIVSTLQGRLAVSTKQLETMPVDLLRRKIDGHVRAEHIAGDTLSVEGWELSVTEARLYALAALLRR